MKCIYIKGLQNLLDLGMVSDKPGYDTFSTEQVFN